MSFILSEKNCGHLYEACSIFKDAGVSHVKLSGVVTSDDVAHVNAYHRAMRSIIEPEIERAKTLSDGAFQIVDHYHELSDTYDNSVTSCPSLMYLTVIGADLNVYTCQDKAYTPAGMLGSLKDRSFKEFWFSSENRDRVLGFDPSRMCRHHCMAHAKNRAMTAALAIDPDHGVFV